MRDGLKTLATTIGWLIIIAGIVVLLLWIGYVFPDTAKKMHVISSYITDYDKHY